MAYLYNHDDEPDSFVCSGKPYELPGHGGIDVPEHIADHAVAYLGAWGVCKLAKPVKNGKPSPQDAAAFAEARKIYLNATRGWAEGVVMDAYRINRGRVEAGLPELAPSEDLTKARKWLADHPA